VDAKQPSEAYLRAIHHGLRFARSLGRHGGPVDLLVGISLGHGPATDALAAGRGRSLREVVAAAGDTLAAGSYLQVQAQDAARRFADGLGQALAPEHLLIALLDQGTVPVTRALAEAGIDPSAARRAALAAIGTPTDQVPLALPLLAPAGTMDRPPLPAGQLDERAWRVLGWRQDHLPMGRVRHPGDAAALSNLERAAAWRLADALGLDDDQRYSLVARHYEQVRHLIAAARPALARPRRGLGPSVKMPRHRRGPLRLTVGWGVWFGNRWVGIRDLWFRLRTAGDYRGCPQP
jgi:hypothetical protein